MRMAPFATRSDKADVEGGPYQIIVRIHAIEGPVKAAVNTSVALPRVSYESHLSLTISYGAGFGDPAP